TLCSSLLVKPRLTPRCYALSLHDALPIFSQQAVQQLASSVPKASVVYEYGTAGFRMNASLLPSVATRVGFLAALRSLAMKASYRSEDHTSELQSRENLVCRLLLERKRTRL